MQASIEREGLCYFDVRNAPFRIHGGFWDNGMFRRIPEHVARSVSTNVYNLHTNCAGIRVRFVTDSPYVAIKTEYMPGKMLNFALGGCCGFDMYAQYGEEHRYEGTFVPPYDVETGYESVIDFQDHHERLITINFPLYSSVKQLFVGIKKGCVLKKADDYRIKEPIVYYGSSITQGGCASKPGSSYQSILSRRFDCDYLNLGFAGSAKAESQIVDYINGLDMSVLVMDYDHNSPSIEHLSQSHKNMFRSIRTAHPDLPIIILPRPKFYLTSIEKERHEVIFNTYLEAKAAGDTNAYFIGGKELMELVGDNGTVDNCHPSDSGFFSMARAIEKELKEIEGFSKIDYRRI